MPLIASGGAGAVEHFPPAVEAGADAVLAASVFHFGELRDRRRQGRPRRRRPPGAPRGRPPARLNAHGRSGHRHAGDVRRPAAQSSSSSGSPSTVTAAGADPLLHARDVAAPQHEAAACRRRAAGVERRRRPRARPGRRAAGPAGPSPAGRGGRPRGGSRTRSVLNSRATGGQASGDHGARARPHAGDDLGVRRRGAQPVLEPVRPGRRAGRRAPASSRP